MRYHIYLVPLFYELLYPLLLVQIVQAVKCTQCQQIT